MPFILLADSGSTKTDWCLLQKGKKAIHLKTGGINPYLQTANEITFLLQNELGWREGKDKASAIYFYGAGAGNPIKQQELANVFGSFFQVKKIEVESDLTGAARALCKDKKGIVSILGTGSNSCYYDGKKIKDKQVSLGYIAGDEGSGNYLGKRILQYYAYNTFDTELRMSFEQLFGDDVTLIINKLYREPFPNRYLASFVQLLIANRGHFMVENIIEDCLNDFFQSHILKYRQSWKQPLHFTGSIAFEFKDVLQALCAQYELDCGKIEKSPIDGLIKYHQDLL